MTESLNITLSSSTSASGTGSWSWTYGTYYCNGGADFSFTKQDGGGVVGVSPTYDATGTWDYSTTGNWVDSGNAGCLPYANRTDTATVTQTGSSVTILDNFEGRTYTGSVYGETYLPYISYSVGGGTTREVLNITLSSSTSGSGIFTWSWTDGTYYCNGGSNISFTKQVEQQFHPYDTNQDWIIGDFELLNAIDDWAAGNLGDFELLDLIDFWAAGSYCWDAAAEKHKPGAHDEYGACQ